MNHDTPITLSINAHDAKVLHDECPPHAGGIVKQREILHENHLVREATAETTTTAYITMTAKQWREIAVATQCWLNGKFMDDDSDENRDHIRKVRLSCARIEHALHTETLRHECDDLLQIPHKFAALTRRIECAREKYQQAAAAREEAGFERDTREAQHPQSPGYDLHLQNAKAVEQEKCQELKKVRDELTDIASETQKISNSIYHLCRSM